jgi:hypothetical protein
MPSYAAPKPKPTRFRGKPRAFNPAWLTASTHAIALLQRLPESFDRTAAIDHLKLIRPGINNRDAKRHRDNAMRHILALFKIKIG